MIELRIAEVGDRERVLEWRNDPESIRASMSKEPVAAEMHQQWFERVLENTKTKLFVADYHRQPVGMVRADLQDDGWRLSWIVAPECRGSGFAVPMVREIIGKLDAPASAVVHRDNFRSHVVATKAGMTKEKVVGDWCFYVAREVEK